MSENSHAQGAGRDNDEAAKSGQEREQQLEHLKMLQAMAAADHARAYKDDPKGPAELDARHQLFSLTVTLLAGELQALNAKLVELTAAGEAEGFLASIRGAARG